MVFHAKGSNGHPEHQLRRRIIGLGGELDNDEIMVFIKAMGQDIGVDINFHNRGDMEKILPYNKETRDALKDILRKHEGWIVV